MEATVSYHTFLFPSASVIRESGRVFPAQILDLSRGIRRYDVSVRGAKHRVRASHYCLDREGDRRAIYGKRTNLTAGRLVWNHREEIVCSRANGYRKPELRTIPCGITER